MWVFPARTIDEAVTKMAPGGLALAGGTVLGPKIIRGEYERTTFVDIRRIDSLKQLNLSDNCIDIGAGVTLSQLIANRRSAGLDRALNDAAAAVGNPHVRNIATVAGNLTSGLAGADLPTALLALGAEVSHKGADGEQRQPVAQILQNGLPGGRLITSILIPRDGLRVSGFAKFAWRRASGITIVNVALSLRTVEGHIAAPGLAVGGPGHHAVRLPRAESILLGRAWDKDLVEEVAQAAATEVVFTTAHSSREQYRRRLVAAGVRQILTQMVPS